MRSAGSQCHCGCVTHIPVCRLRVFARRYCQCPFDVLQARQEFLISRDAFGRRVTVVDHGAPAARRVEQTDGSRDLATLAEEHREPGALNPVDIHVGQRSLEAGERPELGRLDRELGLLGAVEVKTIDGFRRVVIDGTGPWHAFVAWVPPVVVKLMDAARPVHIEDNPFRRGGILIKPPVPVCVAAILGYTAGVVDPNAVLEEWQRLDVRQAANAFGLLLVT